MFRVLLLSSFFFLTGRIVLSEQIRIGRACVDHYREMRRYTVFSHDELICRMALNVSNLGLHIAEAVDKDLAAMLKRETELCDAVTKAVS